MLYTRAFLPAPYTVDLILVAETGLLLQLVPVFCFSSLIFFGQWPCSGQAWVGLRGSLLISDALFEPELVLDIP